MSNHQGSVWLVIGLEVCFLERQKFSEGLHVVVAYSTENRCPEVTTSFEDGIRPITDKILHVLSTLICCRTVQDGQPTLILHIEVGKPLVEQHIKRFTADRLSEYRV